MRSGRTRTAITAAVVAYAIGMAVVAAVVVTTGDSSALGMLLLFGPRWLLVFPWLLLVPLSILASRRTVAFAVIGTAMTLFPVAGYELPVRAPVVFSRGEAGSQALRLVTYNTDGSKTLASRITSDLVVWDADVVLLQDCSAAVAEVLQAMPGSLGQVYRDTEFCVVTRVPLEGLVAKERENGSREDGRAVQFSMTLQGARLSIVTLHLPSPRDALGAARYGNPGLLDGSIQVRFGASRSIAEWVRSRPVAPALIVAGDFNLPAESRALRDDWGALRNAFGEAGWGFGHTMFAGRHRVRIDHVLVSRDFAVRSARVLSGYPSEHQPVVVELGITSR